MRRFDLEMYVSLIIWKFLSLPNSFVTVRVNGKRVNREAWHGLEISVDYIYI